MPAAAKAREMARPTPEEEPVTRATFWWRRGGGVGWTFLTKERGVVNWEEERGKGVGLKRMILEKGVRGRRILGCGGRDIDMHLEEVADDVQGWVRQQMVKEGDGAETLKQTCCSARRHRQ